MRKGVHDKPDRTCLLLLLFILCVFPLFAISASVDNEAEEGKLTPIVAIQIGNTFSRIAVTRDRNTTVFTDANGSRDVPTCVTFAGSTTLVGTSAQQHLDLDPQRTLCGFNNLFSPVSKDLQEAICLSWHKAADRIGQANIQDKICDNSTGLGPEYVVAALLRGLTDIAERELEEGVRNLVVTVPVYFDQERKSFVESAGEIAGLKVHRVASEPIMAARPFGFDAFEGYIDTHHLVLVYDFGATSFVASVVEIDEGVFDLLGTARDMNVGGKTLNKRVMEHIRKSSNSLPDPGILEVEVEKAKRLLSTESSVKIATDLLQMQLTRADFEEMVDPILTETLALVDEAIRNANLSKSEITHIIMTGGSAKIPKIRKMLKEHMGRTPLDSADIEPQEAAVIGAAMLGNFIAESPPLCTLSFGPLSSYSYGVEMANGEIVDLVRQGASLPATRSKKFTTMHDCQTRVNVKVYRRGEGTDGYRYLGTLMLEDLPAAPRGSLFIEITVSINEDEHVGVGVLDIGSRTSAVADVDDWLHDEGPTAEEAMRIEREMAAIAQIRLDRMPTCPLPVDWSIEAAMLGLHSFLNVEDQLPQTCPPVFP